VKDVREVLRQKEEACAHLRKEIEALRFVVPLLDENAEPVREEAVREREEKMPAQGSSAGATQAVPREQDSLRETALVKEESQGRHEEAENTERKAPLSASLDESSWWRRKSR